MSAPSGMARLGQTCCCLAWLLITAPVASLAQSNLRNTFPGNRMGGGTRGECSARFVAHLVPANSVYAPGASGMIGILEGPTANPRPLQVVVKTDVQSSANAIQRDLPASGPGVTLTWTPETEPALMRASQPARIGQEKPHESQTPQPRADHPQVADR